jgi:hypothetical protein
MCKYQEVGVFALKVYDDYLHARGHFLVYIRDNDNIRLEWHRAIFSHKPREVVVVACSGARDRDKNLHFGFLAGDAGCIAESALHVEVEWRYRHCTNPPVAWLFDQLKGRPQARQHSGIPVSA